MKNLINVIVVSSMLLFASCNKNVENCCEPDQTSEASKLPIAMYSLQNTYKMKPEKCEVDEQSIMIKDEVLSNEDIISYSEKDLAFTVTAKGYKKIEQLNDAQPFVLLVAGDVSVVGMFKPFHSSSICEHSVLMNTKDKNKVYFFLGNETQLSESDKVSKVNNAMLISALKETGRLKN